MQLAMARDPRIDQEGGEAFPSAAMYVERVCCIPIRAPFQVITSVEIANASNFQVLLLQHEPSNE